MVCFVCFCLCFCVVSLFVALFEGMLLLQCVILAVCGLLLGGEFQARIMASAACSRFVRVSLRPV